MRWFFLSGVSARGPWGEVGVFGKQCCEQLRTAGIPGSGRYFSVAAKWPPV